MQFRPANINLINRRHYLPRLLLTPPVLKGKCKNKNHPGDSKMLTGHTISVSGWPTTHSRRLERTEGCGAAQDAPSSS